MVVVIRSTVFDPHIAMVLIPQPLVTISSASGAETVVLSWKKIVIG